MDWKLKSSAWLALFVTAAIWLVNLVMQTVFGTSIKSLFAIQLPAFIPTNINPISMTAGQKIVGVVSGYIPFDIPSIVVLYIATLAAVLLGTWIVSEFKINLGAGEKIGRVAKTILVGTIPLYLLIVGFTLPQNFVMVGIFVVIYTVIASYVAAWIASLVGKQI